MFGRPTAVAAASDGQFGAAWSRDELIKVLRTQGARVVAEPTFALPAAHQAFAEDGALVSEDASRRLRELVETLAAQTRAVRDARAKAAASAPSAR